MTERRRHTEHPNSRTPDTPTMKLIDRALFTAFLKAYLLCLVSLLSLYVVIDLFTKLDDFAEQIHGLWPLVKHIATYYGYQVIRIFDQLCEAIVLLAAMFTVAWVQRNNELLPLLSAGVPTRRMLRPILAGATLDGRRWASPTRNWSSRAWPTLCSPTKSDQSGNKVVGVQGSLRAQPRPHRGRSGVPPRAGGDAVLRHVAGADDRRTGPPVGQTGQLPAGPQGLADGRNGAADAAKTARRCWSRSIRVVTT